MNLFNLAAEIVVQMQNHGFRTRSGRQEMKIKTLFPSCISGIIAAQKYICTSHNHGKSPSEIMQMLVFALWPKNSSTFEIANLWPLGKKIVATWMANRGYSSSYRDSVFCFHAGKHAGYMIKMLHVDHVACW